MIKKLGMTMFFAAFFVCCVFVGYSAYGIWSFGEKNELLKTDAAVVLGAAVWENEPSPVFQERINHSIWLYENEYVEKIIFTGGKGDGKKRAESEVARDYAIQNGVDAGDILIETKSRITEENMKYANELAIEHGFDTFSIVSDPLHMKRAMMMARQTGLEAYPSPTTSSAYQTLRSKVPFFLRELFFYVGYVATLPFRY